MGAWVWCVWGSPLPFLCFSSAPWCTLAVSKSNSGTNVGGRWRVCWCVLVLALGLTGAAGLVWVAGVVILVFPGARCAPRPHSVAWLFVAMLAVVHDVKPLAPGGRHHWILEEERESLAPGQRLCVRGKLDCVRWAVRCWRPRWRWRRGAGCLWWRWRYVLDVDHHRWPWWRCLAAGARSHACLWGYAWLAHWSRADGLT